MHNASNKLQIQIIPVVGQPDTALSMTCHARQEASYKNATESIAYGKQF